MNQNNYNTNNPLFLPLLMMAYLFGWAVIELAGYELLHGFDITGMLIIAFKLIAISIPVMLILVIAEHYDNYLENLDITDYKTAWICWKIAIIFFVLAFILQTMFNGMILIFFIGLIYLCMGLYYMPLCRICQTHLKEPITYKDKTYCKPCLDKLKEDFGNTIY